MSTYFTFFGISFIFQLFRKDILRKTVVVIQIVANFTENAIDKAQKDAYNSRLKF